MGPNPKKWIQFSFDKVMEEYKRYRKVTNKEKANVKQVTAIIKEILKPYLFKDSLDKNYVVPFPHK